MMRTLEVLFSPAEFQTLPQRDLRGTVCVVFDILRATSTILTALHHGAVRILPVVEVEEALELHRGDPSSLLAGERGGLRILSSKPGGRDFHFGNSPREFTPNAVRGRTLVLTTTNGTRALRACAGAQNVLIGTFLGIGALVRLLKSMAPPNLLLVGAGTYEQAAYEDTLAAGAVCHEVWTQYESEEIADSAAVARQIYLDAKSDLRGAACLARNGRRLLANPDLRADVDYCFQTDTIPLVAHMTPEGTVKVWNRPSP